MFIVKEENLNFRTIKMLLHFLKTNHFIIDIFADLKAPMEAMPRRSHTVLTEAKIAVDTKHIFFALPEITVIDAWVEELTVKKCTQPICFVLDKDSASNL